MKILSYLQTDFSWWITIFSDTNQSNKIRSGRFVREIFSDASLSGWGAACGKSHTPRMVVRIRTGFSHKYFRAQSSLQRLSRFRSRSS